MQRGHFRAAKVYQRKSCVCPMCGPEMIVCPLTSPSGLATCAHAAETMVLSDVLHALQVSAGLFTFLPGGSAMGMIYKSQVASVEASPDLSCKVKEALNNECRRGAHEGFTPKGQMNPKSVGCELFWTLLAFRWSM